MYSKYEMVIRVHNTVQKTVIRCVYVVGGNYGMYTTGKLEKGEIISLSNYRKSTLLPVYGSYRSDPSRDGLFVSGSRLLSLVHR